MTLPNVCLPKVKGDDDSYLKKKKKFKSKKFDFFFFWFEMKLVKDFKTK